MKGGKLEPVAVVQGGKSMAFADFMKASMPAAAAAPAAAPAPAAPAMAPAPAAPAKAPAEAPKK